MTLKKTLQQPFERDERKRVAALLIFTALIRVLYLYLYSRQSIWSDVVVDSLYHLNWADSIADGDIIGQETYFRAPLYIYFLAFCRTLAPESILLPRLLGSSLGVVSVYLTYLLARRSFPGHVGRNFGLTAGIIQALYPSVIFFEAELLVDFLFTLLLQVTVYRLLIASERNGAGPWAVAGLALGLACLTRPTALALAPFFACYAYFVRRLHITENQNAQKTKGRNFVGALTLVLITALVIAPVTLRNYFVSGDLTLIATSGGVNFFIGNNSEANPVNASLPEPYGANWTLADMNGLAEEYAGRELSPAEVSHSWTMRAVKWIANHPLQFISHYATKVYLAFGARSYSNNRSLRTVYDTNPVLRYSPLNFSFLLFFTIIGVWRFAQSERKWQTALGAFTAALYLLIISLFFITERFRLPALVLFFPAVGAGIVTLWESGATWLLRYKNLAVKNGESSACPFSLKTLIVATLFALLSVLPFGRPNDGSRGRTEYLVANRFLASGKLDEAVGAYRRLLQIDPRYPRAALNLGVAYFLQSQPDSARRYFRLELERSAQNPEALTNLASLALTQGAKKIADSLSELAYRIRPYDLATLRVRVRALHSANKLDQALRVLAESERRFAADPSYWSERMRFYLSLTPPDNERALEAMRGGLALDPAGAPAVENSDWAFSRNQREQEKRHESAALIRYQMGYMFGMNGAYDSAVIYSAKAIALDSSLSAAYVNLTLGYLALGQTDSAQSVYQAALNRFVTGDISRSVSDSVSGEIEVNLLRLQEIMNQIR